MQPYDHKKIEPKWQKVWTKNKAGAAKDPKKGANPKKFYALIEFPYPSGDGLHVGYIRGRPDLAEPRESWRADPKPVMRRTELILPELHSEKGLQECQIFRRLGGASEFV